MFKAGKSINISGNKVINQGAIQVAPSINLQGIILKANEPIHSEVLKFLNERGALVQQIQEDGDTLVRLSGHYQLDAEEVARFIKMNPGIIPQVEEKEDIQAANFQNQVNTRIDNQLQFGLNKMGAKITLFKTVEVQSNEEGQPEGSSRLTSQDQELWNFKPLAFASSQSTIIRVGEINLSGFNAVAGEDFIAEAGAQCNLLAVFPFPVIFGISAEVNARSRVNVSGKDLCNIVDVLMLVGKTLNISSSSGNVKISLSQQALWYNNPNIASLCLLFKPLEAKLSVDESNIALLKKYKLKDFSQESLNQGLRRAAYDDSFADALKFLKMGSNINAQDGNPHKRFTALHLAVLQGHISIIKLLLASDASQDVKDAKGKTVIDYVNESDKDEIKILFNEKVVRNVEKEMEAMILRSTPPDFPSPAEAAFRAI